MYIKWTFIYGRRTTTTTTTKMANVVIDPNDKIGKYTHTETQNIDKILGCFQSSLLVIKIL